jgi:hypothetical protein
MLVLMGEKVIALDIDLVGLMKGFLLGFPFFHIFSCVSSQEENAQVVHSCNICIVCMWVVWAYLDFVCASLDWEPCSTC